MPTTRPSINQLPNMNRQNLERKEVRLGTAQIVGILGVTIGSIIAAFCLGFYSGRSLAFERELSNALASMPKLPIGDQENGADLGEKIVSEVYAKLNEQNDAPPAANNTPEEDNAFPELGTIKEAENTKLDTEEQESQADLLPKAADDELAEVELEHPSEEVIDLPTFKQSDTLIKTPDKSAEKTLGEMKDLKPKASITVVPEKVLVPEKTAIPVKTLAPEKTKAVKTAEPTIKPKEETVSKVLTGQKITTGWYAQIAAPKEQSDASALASKLKKSGFPAVIETADVRGEKYYRVIVGPEKSKVQADVLLKQLKRESYISGDPFLRMVK